MLGNGKACAGTGAKLHSGCGQPSRSTSAGATSNAALIFARLAASACAAQCDTVTQPRLCAINTTCPGRLAILSCRRCTQSDFCGKCQLSCSTRLALGRLRCQWLCQCFAGEPF